MSPVFNLSMYNFSFSTFYFFRIVLRNEDPTSETLLFSDERSSGSDFGRQCSISRNSPRANSFPVLTSEDLSGYDDSIKVTDS